MPPDSGSTLSFARSASWANSSSPSARLPRLGPRQAEVAPVDHQVVADRELRVERVLLGHDAEAAADPRSVDAPGRGPRIRSVPSVTGDTHAIIRIVLVLPAPLGPRKPKLSPARRRSRCASTAVNDPKRFVRPRAWMSGVGTVLARPWARMVPQAPRQGRVRRSAGRGTRAWTSPAWTILSNWRHRTATSIADPTNPNQNGAVIPNWRASRPPIGRPDHDPGDDADRGRRRSPGPAARRARRAGGRPSTSCPTRTRAPRTRRTSPARPPATSSAPGRGAWRSRSAGRPA